MGGHLTAGRMACKLAYAAGGIDMHAGVYHRYNQVKDDASLDPSVKNGSPFIGTFPGGNRGPDPSFAPATSTGAQTIPKILFSR
jgi:hypothetical protein